MNEENVYFKDNPVLFNRLKVLVETSKHGYFKKINKDNELLTWVNSQVAALADVKYKICTKCNWILHGITDFPQCSHCGKSMDQNVHIDFTYPKFCKNCSRTYDVARRNKCASTKAMKTVNDPNYITTIAAKTKQTKLERYGDANYCNIDKAKQTRYVKNDGRYHAADFATKVKKTKLHNFGNENFNNHEKCKQTCLDRYGCENVF